MTTANPSTKKKKATNGHAHPAAAKAMNGKAVSAPESKKKGTTVVPSRMRARAKRAAEAPPEPMAPASPYPETADDEQELITELNNVMYVIQGGIASLPEPENAIRRVNAMYLGLLNSFVELGLAQGLSPETIMEDCGSVMGRHIEILQAYMQQQQAAPPG